MSEHMQMCRPKELARDWTGIELLTLCPSVPIIHSLHTFSPITPHVIIKPQPHAVELSQLSIWSSCFTLEGVKLGPHNNLLYLVYLHRYIAN